MSSERLAYVLGMERRYKWGFWFVGPKVEDTQEFSEFFAGALAHFLLKFGYKLEISYAGVGYGESAWAVRAVGDTQYIYGKYLGGALYNFMNCKTNAVAERFSVNA